MRVERHSRWPKRLVCAVAVLVLLVPMTRLAPEAPEARIPDGPWATEGQALPAPIPSEQTPLPARNQKQAPCTARLEVEVSGACWLSIDQLPPDCPPQTVAYKGKCLWPVPQSLSVPTSMDGGDPGAR